MKTYVLNKVDCENHNVEVLGIGDKTSHLVHLDQIVRKKNNECSDDNWVKCLFLLSQDCVIEYEKRLGYFKDSKYMRYVYQISEFSDEPEPEEEDTDEDEDEEEDYKDAKDNLKNKRKNAVAENKPKATTPPKKTTSKLY
jgi:hypothetical protein